MKLHSFGSNTSVKSYYEIIYIKNIDSNAGAESDIHICDRYLHQC